MLSSPFLFELCSDYKHIRNLLHLCLTDLIADFFCAGVNFRTDSCRLKSLKYFCSIFHMLVRNRQYFHLYRREPGREGSCEVLDQNTDKSFNGPEYYPVNHNRSVFLSVSTCILQIKTQGKLEIELDGSALPCPSFRVFQMEVNLRAVESTVAFIYNVGKADIIQSAAKRVCRHLPVLITAHAVLRTGGKLDMIFESEQAVNLVDKFYNALDFIFDLIRRHKDMGVVLRKAAHTHQTVKLAGFLVTMHKPKLTHADRKIPVGTGFGLVYKNTARTVHRLDCKILFIDYSCIHIFFIVIPVS